jgi:peptidoglycan/LPS O-acetylase OafA/YrhL
MQAKNDNRIFFLDHLRAVACLLVVLGHVYFVGYNGYEAITPYVPSVTSNIFGPDAVSRNVLSEPSIWVGQKLGINVGALGVSIFFLISGFVILRSVDREPVIQFAIRRIFRIYPVCIVAAVFAGIATAIYCHITGTTSPHTVYSILMSGLLLNDYAGAFMTIPVLWSLSIEIAFYILMGILAAAGWLRSRHLILVSTAFAAIAITTASADPHMSFVTLQMTFLLIGSLLYRATSREGVALVFAGCAIFASARYGLNLLGLQGGGADLPNGAWALGIFLSAMLSGMAWAWLRPLKWVADISYPLYLVHIPFAWICLAWLQSIGMGMLSAGVVTAAMIFLVAWAVHALVEEPFRKLGRRLSSGRDAAAVAGPAIES